ncbi:FAD-dependent oxidoreductase, partial [Mesorhizobium sp.]|uniref:FAD-dependent oxidoreductase n=2 Tax=Mesorhizobium sp. TaxID=1871066 RepID=UPI0025805122
MAKNAMLLSWLPGSCLEYEFASETPACHCWSDVRPLGRSTLQHFTICASCFPRIGTDFRAAALRTRLRILAAALANAGELAYDQVIIVAGAKIFMEDVDVVVIGAGSAGLSAAKTLRSAGLSFKLFEAMNRIGGRAWTSDQHFGIPFDIGCAWLHAADRNPYFPEAQAARWTLHHHDMNVDHLYYRNRKASEDEEAAMKAADSRLFELLAAHEVKVGDDDRLSALLAKGHAPRA